MLRIRFPILPHSKTIASFTLPEDRNIFSRVMESHQKNPAANGKILNYIADYFLYPKDTDSLAYISQILQLKAIEYGVEHWRRKRGQCMGSLYWQLNDCWPVASWASIDYYGRWKALHYGARRFMRPLPFPSVKRRNSLLMFPITFITIPGRNSSAGRKFSLRIINSGCCGKRHGKGNCLRCRC